MATAAQQRLSRQPEPTKDERWAMIQALTSGIVDQAEGPLETLSHDQDPEIAADAKLGLEEAKMGEAVQAVLCTGSAEQRARVILALRQAVEKGSFNYKGPSDEIFKALRPEDLPLVHRARSSVLRRLSDECIYEFRTLSAVITTLRTAHCAAAPAGEARP